MVDSGKDDGSREGGAGPLTFTDRDSLKAWLETQPQEISVVIVDRR